MAQTIEQHVPTTEPPRQALDIQASQIARDLALMDEIEAFALSLPDRRSAARVGPLPESAVADAYEAREAGLL